MASYYIAREVGDWGAEEQTTKQKRKVLTHSVSITGPSLKCSRTESIVDV